MASLRERIQSSRNRNVDSKWFVPTGTLNEILTPEAVREVVKHCDVQAYRQKEVADLIVRGGRRTCAILILIRRQALIMRFVESDQLQNVSLDSRLPFSIAALEAIIPSADVIDFFEKQWEFTSPIFRRRRGHRQLDDDTIMPFLDSRPMGEGGFGLVAEVEIHPRHGDFIKVKPEPRTIVVRKELKECSPRGTDEFQRELDVLSFLSYLDHPNILDLLGSYTFKGKHNFIFPRASMNLGQLLLSSESVTGFQDETDFLLALCGLSSGVEKLHDYFSDDLELTLIGCHHDLKPANILVNESTFILADFGLSTMKPASKSSKTLFAGGDGWYMAPECEDTDNDFVPGAVGRASDMWSFGCILAEIATYLYGGGATSIKNFEQRRKVKIRGVLTTYTFHSGNIINPGVESWLSELMGKATPSGRDLICLLKRILQIQPIHRPRATQVLHALRQTALKSQCRAIGVSFGESLKNTGGLELLIEHERFKLYSWAFECLHVEDSDIQSYTFIEQEPIFNLCVAKLRNIKAELTNDLQIRENSRVRVLRLRILNDEIMGCFPPGLRRTLEASLEQKMVQTEDLALLNQIRQTFDEKSAYRAIGTLAAARQMHALCESPKADAGTNLLIKKPMLENRRIVDSYELASLVRDNALAQDGELVLIEQILYQVQWTEDVGKEMFARVAAIADLLRSASNLTNSRVLRCIGYFHEPQRRAFALTFTVPTMDPEIRPISLRKVLQDTRRHNRLRPALDDRIQLAHRLAVALFEIHSVNWLHKSISAFNILFFTSELSGAGVPLASPYLIGFNHSRPNDLNSFSQKEDIEQTDYRHPDCHHLQTRSRQEHDCFSLGLVLLEIGLWRTLKSMTRGKETLSPVNLLEYILQDWVPLLGFYVGKTYEAIVVSCLTGEVGPAQLAPSSITQASNCSMLDHLLVTKLASLLTRDSTRVGQALPHRSEDG